MGDTSRDDSRRSAAGAVSTIALIWLIARVRLSVAESLATLSRRIISTFWSPALGVTVAEPAIQDRAAASASMERGPRRLARANFSKISPCFDAGMPVPLSVKSTITWSPKENSRCLTRGEQAAMSSAFCANSVMGLQCSQAKPGGQVTPLLLGDKRNAVCPLK